MSDAFEQSSSHSSYKETIYKVIDAMLTAEDPSRVDPRVLIDNDYILSKDYMYEEAMNELLEACSSRTSVAHLEKVDAVILSFIVSTRNSRSKLKVNYLVAGASSGRLEEAIGMLASSEEIDEHLLLYLDRLVRKRVELVPPQVRALRTENGNSDSDATSGIDDLDLEISSLPESGNIT